MTGDGDGPMDVTVQLDEQGSAAQLRDLHAWLLREDDLQGRLSLRERPPAPGTLGPVLDAVQVALSSGLATGLVSAIIAWVRYRTADIDVDLRRPDGGRVRISAKRVRGLDATALRAEIESLASQLHVARRGESGPA